MNVREEEKRKNSCPGRGFGLAAAAIGVGVGAALYYFFNQRPENPNGEGSTTEDWQCEQPHTLPYCDESDDESDSYSTISEHSTSDTSIEETNESVVSRDSNNTWHGHSNASTSEQDSDEDSNNDLALEDSNEYSSDSETSEFDRSETNLAIDNSITNNLNLENTFLFQNFSIHHVGNTANSNMDSDSETAMEWDVTTSSAGVPSNEPVRAPMLGYLRGLGIAVSPMAARQMAREDRMKTLREQAFRERSWTLEECSICFEVMLQNQEVMKLQCSHNFHSQCIMPWLQEKQTCPNCRKDA